ncbi:hypothetical protein BDF22DRAFT_671124 [Syncephalis plumigaleata]|nr:hypothetical protein BDF22DRAFT_671124 [Syncephalis plumigaleata]
MTDWQQQQKTHSANTVLEFNLRYLATRWAAKEATYKACYPHQILTWNDVTIYKKHGQPKIRIHNMDSKTNMLDGHLSLSHDGDYVVAFVILTMHSIEGEGQQQQQQQQQQ